jgi:hypothetical protein
MPELGPIEILIVDFDGYRFKGEIMPELERLKEADIVRLVDLLVVRKDRSGALAILTATDLGIDEMLDFAAKAGSLVESELGTRHATLEKALTNAEVATSGHVFDELEAQRLAAEIPNGFAAAVVLLEHRWAIPLRGAIARADGEIVMEEWLTADRLAELGARRIPEDGNGSAPGRR